MPRSKVARRKSRSFVWSPRSMAANASTMVRLLQIRMNVLSPVNGTLRIWFGVAHGPWNVGRPIVAVRRRRVQEAPMMAEKNMISVANISHMPSLRALTRGSRDSTAAASP